jgi:hypothetical protein
MRTHPPRCVGGFKAEEADPPEPWDFCDLVTWKLSCTCGCGDGAFQGYSLKRYNEGYTGDAFVGPLAFECSRCGTVRDILDTAKHGYHAEIGSSSCHIRGEGAGERFVCTQCNGSRFWVLATFFFWEAAIDLIEDQPELAPRAENFFNEFQAHGRCASCGHLSRFTDFGKP